MRIIYWFNYRVSASATIFSHHNFFCLRVIMPKKKKTIKNNSLIWGKKAKASEEYNVVHTESSQAVRARPIGRFGQFFGGNVEAVGPARIDGTAILAVIITNAYI